MVFLHFFLNFSLPPDLLFLSPSLCLSLPLLIECASRGQRDELLATPLHPGLATPSRDAWDPTMTPRHTPAWEADRYDGSTPGEYGSTPTPSGPYYQYDRCVALLCSCS
jgi:hypothetical protein